MRSRWNFLVVLIYAGFATLVLGYMAANMAGTCSLGAVGIPSFHRCETLYVEFKDASGLLHSNDLRVAGVKAGQVTNIDTKRNIAIATIQVEAPFQPVYKNTHAIVRPKNLLGETYVEIDRGSKAAGAYKDGDTIPLAQTITPVQVDEVLNALDPDTRTKLQIVINSLGAASAQRGQDFNISTVDLRRIAADLAITSNTLDQEQGNITALITQLDLLQKTTADTHDQLAQTLTDWEASSATLMKHDVQFADALTHLGNVMTTLDSALTPTTPALTSAVAKLPSAVTHAQDFLGISSTITDTFLTARQGNTYPLQDGVSLFPRLSQVMLGANRCDTHVYGNGYANVPGNTENSACPPANGSFTGEHFTATPAPNTVSSDRHLWRVMAMLDPDQTSCGILSFEPLLPPKMLPPSNPACSPGNNGLDPYQGQHHAATQGTNTTGSSSQGGVLQQLWNDLFGGAHA